MVGTLGLVAGGWDRASGAATCPLLVPQAVLQQAGAVAGDPPHAPGDPPAPQLPAGAAGPNLWGDTPAGRGGAACAPAPIEPPHLHPTSEAVGEGAAPTASISSGCHHPPGLDPGGSLDEPPNPVTSARAACAAACTAAHAAPGAGSPQGCTLHAVALSPRTSPTSLTLGTVPMSPPPRLSFAFARLGAARPPPPQAPGAPLIQSRSLAAVPWLSLNLHCDTGGTPGSFRGYTAHRPPRGAQVPGQPCSDVFVLGRSLSRCSCRHPGLRGLPALPAERGVHGGDTPLAWGQARSGPRHPHVPAARAHP